MNALINALNEAKSNGYTHIWADCDSVANNGLEYLIRNGHVTKSREEADAAIMAEFASMNPVAHANGRTPASPWIWSIEEEINNASA